MCTAPKDARTLFYYAHGADCWENASETYQDSAGIQLRSALSDAAKQCTVGCRSQCVQCDAGNSGSLVVSSCCTPSIKYDCM